MEPTDGTNYVFRFPTDPVESDATCIRCGGPVIACAKAAKVDITFLTCRSEGCNQVSAAIPLRHLKRLGPVRNSNVVGQLEVLLGRG